MLTTFFNWLQRRTTESILAGVNDAARQLQDEEQERPTVALLWHRAAEEEAKPVRKVKAS